MLSILLPGCGGCGDDVQSPDKKTAEAKQKADKEKADKAKEKPKPDFDPMRLQILPGDRLDALRSVKPGHWSAATVQTRANNFDFKGRLSASTTSSTLRPLDIEGTPFYLMLQRPAVLPKGQIKQLELTLFVPRSVYKQSLLNELRDASDRIGLKRESEPLHPMPPYQYQMLVLSRQPGRYAFLSNAESVRPRVVDPSLVDEPAFYRVIAPLITNQAPLPHQTLLWTSLAYIVWDDVNPQICDPEQQQCLLDWLYWGGHLIINGPRSMDSLRGSFLEPFLPAIGAGSRELTVDDLAELQSNWKLSDAKRGQTDLRVGKPWPGIRLTLQSGGHFLESTGELVAERRLGRGRILVAALPLTQPELTRWRGFDGFLNACLLRRLPRQFDRDDMLGLLRTRWLDDSGEREVRNLQTTAQVNPLLDSSAAYRLKAAEYWNPSRATHLRFFARDAGILGNPSPDVPSPPDDGAPARRFVRTAGTARWRHRGLERFWIGAQCGALDVAARSWNSGAAARFRDQGDVGISNDPGAIELGDLPLAGTRGAGLGGGARGVIDVRRSGHLAGAARHRFCPQQHRIVDPGTSGRTSARALVPLHGLVRIPVDELRPELRG